MPEIVRRPGSCGQAGIPLFINARTDIFLQHAPEHHNHSLLEEALIRSSHYADAGASGLFVPGLQDHQLIQELCERSPLPINVMVTSPDPSPKQLATLGVARVSYGPYPYLQVMEHLKRTGEKTFYQEINRRACYNHLY